MKIISWNVNGIRAVAKKGFYEFVQLKAPDVLCLQETKAHPDQIEPALLNPFQLKSYWSSANRPGYSGTVTYSNLELKRVDYGIGIKKFDSEGRFVVTDHDDFLIYNVYFPNGSSREERHLFKQEFLKKIAEHLQKTLKSGREVILVGDYNVAHQSIDVYDPVNLVKESGFLPEEQKWFTEFLNLGFVDLFRHFHPNEKQKYTWWSYLQNGRLSNRGWRIDYICASRGLLNRVRSCEIWDEVEGSDHCPVFCELS